MQPHLLWPSVQFCLRSQVNIRKQLDIGNVIIPTPSAFTARILPSQFSFEFPPGVVNGGKDLPLKLIPVDGFFEFYEQFIDGNTHNNPSDDATDNRTPRQCPQEGSQILWQRRLLHLLPHHRQIRRFC